MIGALGLTATVAGTGVAIVGLLLSLRAARAAHTNGGLIRYAWVAAIAFVLANLVMVTALVERDFSIAYVARIGSRATPLLYTVASLWGALEGSILFWAGLLAAVTLLFAWRSARTGGAPPVAMAVLFGLMAFFGAIVAGPGSPWGRVSPVPSDGPGPNPLLQNHPLMVVHPPLLYLGFVGLAVPFAVTVAALVAGRLDRSWLETTRRWTLGPWVALTAGLVLGAWWSYAVLGWGGYWAWDPVENVALLPWLTATAFLHSAMVQERRGILGGWNVGLVIASFVLTILATLITRSGILNSVHAFTQSLVGPLFLVLLGATIVGSIVLVGLRLPDNGPARSRLGARSTGFLLNNLLLSAIAATVLFGTLFPLLAEAVGAGQVSVGAPYFERLVGPLAVGLLVLLGIGPFLPWGVWSPASRRRLIPGAGAALAVASAVVVAGGGSEATAGAAAGTFALVQSARSVVQRIVSIGRRAGGIHTSVLPAGRGRRSVGGLLAHVGIAVIALAVIGSSTGRREVGQAIAIGGRFVIGPYELRLDGFQRETRPDRMIVSAVLVVRRGSSEITAAPSLSFFSRTSSAIATPAVFSGLSEDLYVTLTDVDPAAGTATVRVGLHPFQVWLWIGGAIAVAGGLIAAWPGARRSVRRLGDPDGQPIDRPVAPRNALHGVAEDGSR